MKKKIYKFLNGIAYPAYDGYRVRVGMKWEIEDSNDLLNHYQIVKYCPVNTYRYPFLQFSKDEYEVQLIGAKVGTTEHLKQYLGNVNITRM